MNAQQPAARIREIGTADLPELAAMNDAAYPAVPMTPLDDFAALVRDSSLALAVEGMDARLDAFLIAFQPGSDYASENYRFFESRGVDHLYVDRIVVAEHARGRGLGRTLYEAVFAAARAAERAEVTCEVNLDPPNPASLAFHARMGFERVGSQVTKGGAVEVALLAAAVAGRPG